MFIPEAIVYHMHAYTTKKQPSEKMTFLMERNSLITYFKILKIKTIVALLPYVILMRFMAIIKDMLTLRFKNSFSRIKALFWVMFNPGLIKSKRKQVQSMRKVDDKFILSAFTEKYLFKKKVLL